MLRSLLLIALLLLPTAPAFSEILVTTEEYPPYNMTVRGEVVGIATALVRAMFARAGIPYRIEVLPWNRAYQEALATPDSCVYSTTETGERKPLFEWVGPLVTNDWVLFARSDARPLTRLEEVGDKIVGGYSGDAAALYLAARGYKVDAAREDGLNPAKLINGRIDYWVSGSELGPYLARQQGIADIRPVLTFKTVALSLACNRGTDPQVLARLRQALAGLKRKE